MELKKLLMIGCLSLTSVACVMAQNSKAYYYQPNASGAYLDGQNDEDEALNLDEEEELNNFQKNAGLTIRDEKHTKRSGKRLEKDYERSARSQNRMNRAEDRKIKRNERMYFRENRKGSQKV